MNTSLWATSPCADSGLFGLHKTPGSGIICPGYTTRQARDEVKGSGPVVAESAIGVVRFMNALI